MGLDLENLPEKAKEEKASHLTSFKKLKKKKNFDYIVHQEHDQAFEKIDCLDCGNCCKTTSPIFIVKDIERIAKHLRMKPSAFMEQYLRFDEDNHYVLKEAPCPFLGEDNYCGIYKVRPRACSEYPHTNRKKMYQLEELTLNNASICPAVFNILERLKELAP